MTIDQIRSLCLSLPAVTEDVKWHNDLCFCVGEKMFCVVSMEVPVKLSFKVHDENVAELVEREEFIPAPYLARAKWVTVVDPSRLDAKELGLLVRQSYQIIASKLSRKVRKQLGMLD